MTLLIVITITESFLTPVVLYKPVSLHNYRLLLSLKFLGWVDIYSERVAAVNPGGTTINNKYEFIKLVGNLPTGNIIGLNLTSTGNSIIVEVLEAVERVSASEPATIYVKYVSTTGGTSGTTPVRVTAGDTLTGGGETLTVQTTNTVANPATGTGTRVSIHAGRLLCYRSFCLCKRTVNDLI